MKKTLLFVVTVLVLACMLAFSVSAAEPDTSKETVTLSDGTACPLWDTDGDALIWYISATDDAGVNTYSYVKATSDLVDYNCGWSGGSIGGAYQYQVGTMTIKDENGVSYAASKVVVANLMDDIKITSGSNIEEDINSFTKTFTSSTNLQYIYLPLGTVSVNAETFKGCSNLKYVNLMELTELRQINSQAFSGCTSLFAGTDLDLSNTKLINVLQGGFNNIAATSITLPTTFTTVGEWAFQNCKYATSINFTGTLTSLNTNSTFKECYKLQKITGLEHLIENGTLKNFGNYMFYKCYALNDVPGLIENDILKLPEGCTSVGQFTFSDCDAITAIIFPSTINKIYQQGFSYMGSVKLVSFDKKNEAIKNAIANGESYTPFAFDNCGHFRGLTSLVAISLPEGLVEVNNRALADCTNLTAVYLPDSVKRFSSNGGGQGTFCNSTKMYFVHDSFTVSQCINEETGEIDLSLLVLPEKPDVYFMPESLETFTGHIYSNDTWSNASIFKNCTSVNSVLVFPESFTKMVTMRPFDCMGTETSPKTVVFLGDIEQFTISHQSKYINFVFANANDTFFDSFDIMRVAGNSNEKGSYAYFCSTGKKYDLNISGRQGTNTDPTTEENIAKIAATRDALKATETDGTCHVEDVEARVETTASCLTPKSLTTYCFCGAIISSTQDGEALGHDFEGGEAIISFGATLYDNASSCVACVRGCGANGEATDLGAIITEKGYSSCDIGGIKSFTRGYFVNKELLKIYEEKYDLSVTIGFAFTLADRINTEAEYGLDDFAVNMELKKSGEELTVENLDYMVRYKTDAYVDTMVFIAGYYSEKDNVIFSDMLEEVSYNSIAKQGNITVGSDGTVNGSVDIGNLLG